MHYEEAELLEELDEQLDDYKRSRKYKKLSFQQWFDLNTQFVKTPQIDRISPEVQFYPAGEHVVLRSILNQLGYFPSDRNEVMTMAYDLLIMGYE